MTRIAIVTCAVIMFICNIACPADEGVLTVATGNPASTYSMMVKSLGCCPVKEFTDTTGGFDNVNLLMTRKVNMGFVPEDVLEMARRTDPNVFKNIRTLVGMHFNPLHIIVLKDGASKGKGGWLSKLGIGKEERSVIQDLRDLKGKKIACFGSAIVTGEFLNERLQAGLELIRVKTPAEGTNLLKNGEVVAVFATAGWPIEWVNNLDPNVFTLASLDDGLVKKMGEPYKVVKLNYQALNAMGVTTAAPRNVIAVWNYASPSKVDQLTKFRQCIIDNLLEIKETDGSHPAWNEVDTEDFSWPKYEGATTKARK
jgi:TRAP-type uncharacterized transport system substrate-binding protein